MAIVPKLSRIAVLKNPANPVMEQLDPLSF
jgi:hypothetical protein